MMADGSVQTPGCLVNALACDHIYLLRVILGSLRGRYILTALVLFGIHAGSSSSTYFVAGPVSPYGEAKPTQSEQQLDMTSKVIILL